MTRKLMENETLGGIVGENCYKFRTIRVRVKFNREALLLAPALEQEGAVRSAKAEGVRHRVFHGGFARMVGNKIHSGGIRILIFQVDGWRKNLVAQREHGYTGFQTACSPEQVPGHGFCRADRDFVIAEKVTDRVRFERIADRSRRSVGIHVL